jgi:hypothetical protein
MSKKIAIALIALVGSGLVVSESSLDAKNRKARGFFGGAASGAAVGGIAGGPVGAGAGAAAGGLLGLGVGASVDKKREREAEEEREYRDRRYQNENGYDRYENGYDNGRTSQSRTSKFRNRNR